MGHEREMMILKGELENRRLGLNSGVVNRKNFTIEGVKSGDVVKSHIEDVPLSWNRYR
jgi:hypothetical protein